MVTLCPIFFSSHTIVVVLDVGIYLFHQRTNSFDITHSLRLLIDDEIPLLHWYYVYLQSVYLKHTLYFSYEKVIVQFELRFNF